MASSRPDGVRVHREQRQQAVRPNNQEELLPLRQKQSPAVTSRHDRYTPRHQGKEEMTALLQQQAQLPSFRDIIPSYLHPGVETQPQTTSSVEGHSDTLTPTSHALSATSRSIAASPAQSQGSSMPSLTEGFEEVTVRGNDNMYPAQGHPIRSADRASSWLPASQYPEMSSSYVHSAQRVPQLSSQHAASRASPSLPPLRDINQRTDRLTPYDPTYPVTTAATANSGNAAALGQVSRLPQYNPHNMFGTGQAGMGDMDSFGNSRMQYFSSSYPATTRPFSGSYPSYDSFSNGYTYPGTYPPYPNPVVSSQHSHYGINGDGNGLHSRRRRGNLPKQVTDILRTWFHEHLEHPYPSEEDKQIFIQQTGLTISQISNWFINARRRHWPALKAQRGERIRNANLRRSNSGSGSV